MAKVTKSSTKNTSKPSPISKVGTKREAGQRTRKTTPARVVSASSVKPSGKRARSVRITKPDSPEQAIALARNYLVKLLDLTEEPILEEIEINKDKHWYVTFSISDASRGNLALLPLIPRKYKTLKIDSTSGALVSISIHDGKKYS